MSALVQDQRDLEALLNQVRFRPRASLEMEVLGRWARGDGPTPAPDTSRRRGVWLILGLVLLGVALWLLLSPADGAPLTRMVDRCCQDLDGGGHADDGLLVTSRLGSEVRHLIVYEDRDRSGSFSPADTVRFFRSGRPSLHGPIEPGMRTFELCCRDYDGDGPPDDVLLIVARPPDHIALAAIYQGPGKPLR